MPVWQRVWNALSFHGTHILSAIAEQACAVWSLRLVVELFHDFFSCCLVAQAHRLEADITGLNVQHCLKLMERTYSHSLLVA